MGEAWGGWIGEQMCEGRAGVHVCEQEGEGVNELLNDVRARRSGEVTPSLLQGVLSGKPDVQALAM